MMEGSAPSFAKGYGGHARAAVLARSSRYPTYSNRRQRWNAALQRRGLAPCYRVPEPEKPLPYSAQKPTLMLQLVLIRPCSDCFRLTIAGKLNSRRGIWRNDHLHDQITALFLPCTGC